jgi:hypothetical protein
MKGKQMAHRVHRRMDLQSFAPFGSIVARSRTRLRRGLQRAAVQDHGDSRARQSQDAGTPRRISEACKYQDKTGQFFSIYRAGRAA